MSVALLLQQYPQLQLQSNNKILCSLTNHEMSPQYKAIISHVEGKKFKKAMEWYKHDFSNYLPHIVPHKRDDKKLFCVLTKETLNKIPAEIEKHVNGKRFLRFALFPPHIQFNITNNPRLGLKWRKKLILQRKRKIVKRRKSWWKKTKTKKKNLISG